MIIPLERHIEDAIFNDPSSFPAFDGNHRIDRWLARQYRVPNGIIDLLGLASWEPFPGNDVVVVEVKRGRIDDKAIAQVCRYADDIKLIRSTIEEMYGGELTPLNSVSKIIVGSSVDKNALLTARALNVRLMKYVTSPFISVVGEWAIPASLEVLRYQQAYQLADDSPFETWVEDSKNKTTVKAVEEFKRDER